MRHRTTFAGRGWVGAGALGLLLVTALGPGAVGFAAATPPEGIQCPEGHWQQIKAYYGRYGHAAIFDPLRKRMVVYGGVGGGEAARRGDCRALDLDGPPEWTDLAPTGASPGPRAGHSAIYDPVNDRMIVFGGDGGNDTWALDLAGEPTWTQLFPSGGPPGPRQWHTAVYDEARRAMLIDGGVNYGNPSPYYNDTWALSLVGPPVWTRLNPTGDAPGGHAEHAAMYDPPRDRMLISTQEGDVWALTLAGTPTWNRLAPAGTTPPWRRDPTAIYDPQGDRMILCGGWFRGDTWALSLDGAPAWNEIAPVSGGLPGRRQHTAVYDPFQARMVVFGGQGGCSDPPTSVGDVWSLSLSGPPTWSELVQVEPCGRNAHRAVYAALHNSMVIMGGAVNIERTTGGLSILSLDGRPTWRTPGGVGLTYAGHSLIYDSRRDHVVSCVLGGTGGYAFPPGGLQPVPLPAPALPGESPPMLQDHSAIYDPVRDEMVIFGGHLEYPPGIPRDETWVLSFSGPSGWRRLNPGGSPPPAAFRHAAIYDPVRDRMIVYGGYFSLPAWALSLGPNPTWTPLSPGGPTPPTAFDAAYDARRDRMLIVSGGEVWALYLAGTPRWALVPVSGTFAGGGGLNSIVYDPPGDRLLLYGGSTADEPFDGQVWALNFGGGGTSQVAAVSPAECITPGHPAATVPFRIDRSDATALRAFSVTFRIGPHLALNGGLAAIEEGPYLHDIGATAFAALERGDGSYTVDGLLLGLPCGATAATGTLFSVTLAGAGAEDGTDPVVVESVELRDCANATLPAAGGPAAFVTVDATPPAAIENLAAARLTGGNDGDGTTRIQVSFAAPPDAASLEIYRAGFGTYPEYDDAGGMEPVLPAYPPAAPWVKTALTASGQIDEPPGRDFWNYVAFSRDACGNVSAVSNRTNGTPNYHLGDVCGGSPGGPGDNRVNTADLSYLGAHYGALLAPNGDPLNVLDIGPTLDRSAGARPITDNRLNFEDLVVLGLNYGQVSKPTARANRAGEEPALDTIALRLPPDFTPGRTGVVGLDLDGSGVIHGLSLRLDYDATIVEPVAIEGGELLARQAAEAAVLSEGPGRVDIALMGASEGLRGRGELVRMAFRVRAPGDPRITLAPVEARDAHNASARVAVAEPREVGPAGLPRAPWLGAPWPNPLRERSSLPFGLARPADTQLALFDVRGRLVRTLVTGPMNAGNWRAEWDGRDAAGRRVASGVYLVRLVIDGKGLTTSLRVVR